MFFSLVGCMFLSESLLREDDIFYESMRAQVERAFGAPIIETQNHLPPGDMHLIHISNRKLKKLILTYLDNLTTKGLYHLAMIITGSLDKSEITRCKLKKIIKASLSSVIDRRSHNDHQQETRKKISQLLTNPQYFRVQCEPLSSLGSHSCHADAAKVLHELQNLPTQTLIAMRRKLKGVKARIPQLQPQKHGWGRDHLINLVKKISEEMLSQLDGGNDLQEPLAKAMAVAEISLRLTTGCRNIFSKEFYQFSPEVQSLQNDIMNAIWSVKKVVTVQVLRNLQLLIEPKATISNRCIRTAFVNFLTEFLFECSDMECIPESLSQILDVINRSSNNTQDVLFQKKYIEDDVDCILSVSAQTKQIVLDLLPNNEFDLDFTDAYMEELEESDDGDSEEDADDNQLRDRQFINGTFNSMDSNDGAESVGDFAPFEFHPSAFVTEENVPSGPPTTGGMLNRDSEKLQPKNCDAVNLESEVHNTPQNMFANHIEGENVVTRHDFYECDTEIDPRDAANLFCKETEHKPTRNSICKNQYLEIQEACDKTSMLAYNLIGHLLGEFAVNEGLDLNMSKKSYLSRPNQIEDVQGLVQKIRTCYSSRD